MADARDARYRSRSRGPIFRTTIRDCPWIHGGPRGHQCWAVGSAEHPYQDAPTLTPSNILTPAAFQRDQPRSLVVAIMGGVALSEGWLVG